MANVTTGNFPRQPVSIDASEPRADVPLESADLDLPFEQDASRVLENLRQALSVLLRAAALRPLSAANVSRFFGVDKALGWNIYRIAFAPSSMAAGINVPARVSIERFLKGAAAKKIPETVILQASAAFDQFDRLVEAHAEDRSELETMILSSLPDQREKSLGNSREMMFKAAREIRGISARTHLFLVIAYPSKSDPSKLDVVRVNGCYDLKRLNRNTRIKNVSNSNSAVGSPAVTLDGRSIEGLTDTILPEFCSDPMLRMRAHNLGPNKERIEYVLEADDLGIKSAITFVKADVLPAYLSRFATPERRYIGAALIGEHPCRLQITDILVYEGVVPPQQPQVNVYETCPNGPFKSFNDPSHEDDRVDFTPATRHMGRGPKNFETVHVPRYREMVEHICRIRGWDSSKLQGYRSEIEYPVYSWFSQMTLTLPEKPAAGADGR